MRARGSTGVRTLLPPRGGRSAARGYIRPTVDYFSHRDGRLHCEGVPLDALADAVGTPAYVYSRRTVVEHLKKIQASFAELSPLVCFALKANSNLALLDVVRREGAGF